MWQGVTLNFVCRRYARENISQFTKPLTCNQWQGSKGIRCKAQENTYLACTRRIKWWNIGGTNKKHVYEQTREIQMRREQTPRRTSNVTTRRKFFTELNTLEASFATQCFQTENRLTTNSLSLGLAIKYDKLSTCSTNLRCPIFGNAVSDTQFG